MAKEKQSVTVDFIDQCREMISEFGAVRKNAFQRYIEMALDASPEMALMIVNKLAERQDIYTAKYADTTIVKTDKKHKTTYRYLDVFDAYLYLFAEAKEKNSKETVFANSASFPVDFSFYDTTGILYNVFVYDDHVPQKLSVVERKKTSYKKKTVTLIVFPVGTNLQKAAVPKVEGKYRYAVVKKYDDGSTVCQMTEICGEEK